MSQTSFNSSRHKDSFGFIRSVLTGVTQFTDRAYRSMKVVLPHMANRDLLSYNVQPATQTRSLSLVQMFII
jgi:hypothetical protein